MYAIVAIFKNEARYLYNWLEFHRAQGFDTFYLFDNNSTDNWKNEIGPDCMLIPWSGDQMSAYRTVLVHPVIKKEKFVAFLDIDEFLFSPEGTITKKLDELRVDAGCVYVPWKVFGSSGEKKYSPQSVWERFQKRAFLNAGLGKSIVRMSAGPFTVKNPHEIVPKKLKTVWADGNVNPDADEIIRLHHYYCRSEEEFALKILRGQPNNITKRSMKDFFDTDAYANAVEDSSAVDAYNKMKNEIQFAGK